MMNKTELPVRTVRYSKPSGPLIAAKQDFFKNNDELRDISVSINRSYAKQQPRRKCKNCEMPLGEPDFISFAVPYIRCQCGHLNGAYEDSDEFVSNLYAESRGDNYKRNYILGYDQRVRDIYLPKLEFLSEVIEECGDRKFTITDIGCGGGHFVKACEVRDVQATGYDPSAALIEMGSEKLASNTIRQCGIEDFEDLIAKASSSVVSMIGVLEHVPRPRDAIAAFKRSPATYLYISVPLFSLSVLIEHCFPTVYPRQLSGAHTHLYTKQSLEYLSSEFDLPIVGEWWFGTDFVDLYRTLFVLSESDSTKYHADIDRFLGSHIDQLQSVLDQSKLCSEVHMVFKNGA
jgi:hypothetical protein